MKKNPEVKYVEDLLEEDEIDVDAVLKAKFRHPIRQWLQVRWFFFWSSLELKWVHLKFSLREIFKNK
jgi:hypothetical protein